LYQRRDLSLAAAFHATAPSEAKSLRDLGFQQPIICIPNGIRHSDANLAADRRDRESPNSRTALFLSRFHPKKGLPLLVEAWQRVAPEGWRLLAVGPDEGGHRHDIERLTEKFGIRESWEFRDMVTGDEKWRLLGNADLFILPTHSENFGNVVAESLTAGTPVITTTGAPWSELSNRQCGWWTEPTVDGIAAALKEATELPNTTLSEMGHRGRVWASQEFAWPGIAQRMANAYEAILSRTTTADSINQ
jgi:glycosyltransferase involved in cell wall biosynthesis